MICEKCNGEGLFNQKICPNCAGTGKNMEEEIKIIPDEDIEKIIDSEVVSDEEEETV